MFADPRSLPSERQDPAKSRSGSIRIAGGNPIDCVNLLYTFHVDRIHRIDRTHDYGFDQS